MAQSQKRIDGDETVHYVSARKRRGEAQGKAMQPPLTPMIDVTFQLLIFFILTISFRTAEGQIPGSLPSDKGQKAEPSVKIDPMQIVLTPTGDWREKVVYELNGTTIMDPATLYEHLERKKTTLGDDVEAPVVIKARGDVRWKYVVEAFNQAVAADFKNIGFAQS